MEQNKIRLEIVSAEEELFSDDVEMVFAPGIMGELGITPKHTPLITTLKAGDVRAQLSASDTKIFFVSGGLLEIQPNTVTILSDTAIREDASMNLVAVSDMKSQFPNLEIILIESGGDNLAATFFCCIISFCKTHH